MERRKFTREFKLEAVRLIRDRGVSYAQASQDLGVHQSQLRDWAKKFAEDPQHSFPGHRGSGLVTAMAPDQPDPNAVVGSSSQPPSLGYCDHCLSPPSIAASSSSG